MLLQVRIGIHVTRFVVHIDMRNVRVLSRITCKMRLRTDILADLCSDTG